MSGEPIVYLGPSLPVEEAERLLAADYRPPVKRGDLPASVGGRLVIIIDGEFGQNLSVSPKEILKLLDQGASVIGASSMGALRAAELHPFGMEGCGWVFENYRSGRIVGDDEVALAYSPFDARPLTIPLVNVRYWLNQLNAAGVIDPPTARRLLNRARRIFFAERTPERLEEEFAAVVGEAELQGVLKIKGGITDIKADDARLALTCAASRSITHQQQENL